MKKAIWKFNANRVFTDEPAFSEKQMIQFGELVAREGIKEHQVIFYFGAIYEVKEAGNE